MDRVLWVFTLPCLLFLCLIDSIFPINIALHAQLAPSSGKVVGSVITTNGLCQAFRDRPDVDLVDIFYPAHYTSYLNNSWDLVLIEGWFPSIEYFLILSRNNFPKAKIVFISLDPIYPGKEIVHKFDLDGILTNSVGLVDYYKAIFPTELMLLAADPAIMRPYRNITREYGTIYIGAGGNMLDYKPELYTLLLSAAKYNLRLHGNGWESVPILNKISQGGLPQLELARAYASAQVVLGSTIDAQSQYHMINNRIFEALSCGSLVVSKYSEELNDLRCDALFLTNETHTLDSYMQRLRELPSKAVEKLRASARDFIISRHTWSHRAVQIVDFYHQLSWAPAHVLNEMQGSNDVCGNKRCTRANCPTLLWLVSSHLQGHHDYLQVAKKMGTLHLCELFELTVPSSAELFAAELTEERIRLYDFILCFATPFDALDVSMRALGEVPRLSQYYDPPVLQKRAVYLIGFDSALVSAYLAKYGSKDGTLSFRHYDSVWFRSPFEVDILTTLNGADITLPGRLQQMFGIGALSPTTIVMAKESDIDGVVKTDLQGSVGDIVVVCQYPHVDLCCRTNRDHFVRAIRRQLQDASGEVGSYTMLLLGGSWDDWLGVRTGYDGLAFLTLEELRSVVHVSAGRVGDAARAVQHAKGVVILNPSFGDNSQVNDLRQCMSSAHSGATESRSSLLLSCQTKFGVSTTEETLWPLVAAAVTSARIHVLNLSPQLMDLTNSACADWSEDAFLVMIQTGVNRLAGLGSIRASVTVGSLSLKLTRTGDKSRPLCVGCSGDDGSMVDGFFESHSNLSWTSSNAPEIRFLKMDYDRFSVGRDGECCIQQQNSFREVDEDGTGRAEDEGVQIPGDKVCLMRPYRYVALVFRPPKISTVVCPILRSLDVAVLLRGSFFGDSFYDVAFSINIESSLPTVPIVWNNSWIVKFNAFVYVVSIC